ncbi:hypothetical protein CANCADRAFT_3403 [Tortispora caseinolytica NRRL Y-17796]|uniref:Uncharacterized protein n=1 Tax=Tortispora caseinolytica NRRL Y-17796 TaxID=767744 RepID=A0A1E4TAS8_9ASCO|nr:hypothetical protein CANCADRAFT_3403 [Tortispora caseinolytica NRRL Y-17796]
MTSMLPNSTLSTSNATGVFSSMNANSTTLSDISSQSASSAFVNSSGASSFPSSTGAPGPYPIAAFCNTQPNYTDGSVYAAMYTPSTITVNAEYVANGLYRSLPSTELHPFTNDQQITVDIPYASGDPYNQLIEILFYAESSITVPLFDVQVSTTADWQDGYVYIGESGAQCSNIGDIGVGGYNISGSYSGGWTIDYEFAANKWYPMRLVFSTDGQFQGPVSIVFQFNTMTFKGPEFGSVHPVPKVSSVSSSMASTLLASSMSSLQTGSISESSKSALSASVSSSGASSLSSSTGTPQPDPNQAFCNTEPNYSTGAVYAALYTPSVIIENKEYVADGLYRSLPSTELNTTTNIYNILIDTSAQSDKALIEVLFYAETSTIFEAFDVFLYNIAWTQGYVFIGESAAQCSNISDIGIGGYNASHYFNDNWKISYWMLSNEWYPMRLVFITEEYPGNIVINFPLYTMTFIGPEFGSVHPVPKVSSVTRSLASTSFVTSLSSLQTGSILESSKSALSASVSSSGASSLSSSTGTPQPDPNQAFCNTEPDYSTGLAYAALYTPTGNIQNPEYVANGLYRSFPSTELYPTVSDQQIATDIPYDSEDRDSQLLEILFYAKSSITVEYFYISVYSTDRQIDGYVYIGESAAQCSNISDIGVGGYNISVTYAETWLIDYEFAANEWYPMRVVLIIEGRVDDDSAIPIAQSLEVFILFLRFL